MSTSYLLDTHTFLFLAFNPPQMSDRVRSIVLDRGNPVLLSVVSLWEIALKYSLGKLTLSGVAPQEMPQAASEMGLTILDLTADDTATFHMLERTAHRDPFDRMLIWQAIRKRLVLLSRDASFEQYISRGLQVIW